MQVAIRRPVTIILLLAATVAIAAFTIWTSGKSYGKVSPLPFEDIRHLAQRLGNKPISTQILAVIVVPIIGNIIMFVPWGFLTFISLYSVERPTVQTYVLTILLGFTLSICIEAWQYFLPSR